MDLKWRRIEVSSREEHTRHCKELYGYGFEEVHKWMDGTVKSRGRGHRVDRHDIKETPEKAYKIFKDKVPNQYTGEREILLLRANGNTRA
ncbi:hypothetical protein AKJ41_04625 [candidate division MSBL1 archaeon SCGC-AAA259O05]|uniref:Uncharacterized protein n=1 Tax=candidate division MSBL1 archaeon SCGC-AAA259O05 TaxID=1698271 RepID=A0A133V0J3_9EURY|nr:hypothetical protein AKJ41_04625 [candidate division MSBL1 archaeon SCGC-AAA259O05]